jgi:hypothetical protein
VNGGPCDTSAKPDLSHLWHFQTDVWKGGGSKSIKALGKFDTSGQLQWTRAPRCRVLAPCQKGTNRFEYKGPLLICGSGIPLEGRGRVTLKARSFILAAALVVDAANSAYACNLNRDCRAIFTEPLSRKTTEGTDELCEGETLGCQSCLRDKVRNTGVTLECATCVVSTPLEKLSDLDRCDVLCGGAAKVRTVFFAAGCM